MSPRSETKVKLLDRIADDNGVAVVVLDENSREVSASNNNSICRALTASPDFAPKCAQFCGVAFQRTASGAEFDYECYAGLTCKAIPVADRGKQFVAIIGRTFTSADNYRKATDRAIAGDWSEFPPNEFFENVLMDSSVSSIDKAKSELARFRVEKAPDVLDLDAPTLLVPAKPAPAKPVPAKPVQSVRPRTEPEKIAAVAKKTAAPPTAKPTEQSRRRAAEAGAVRSLVGKLSNLGYDAACSAVLEFLRSNYGLDSVVWLERHDGQLVATAARGAFSEKPIRIGITADNSMLVTAAQKNIPLELKERMPAGSPVEARTLSVFPSTVGGDIQGAIGVEGRLNAELLRSVGRLCRRVGPQLELLRLTREVSSREWVNRATARVTESLKKIDADDFWTQVTQISAELVQSERASLLVRDERDEDLRAKASVGAKIDLASEPNVGSRIARVVLEHGKPVVVQDINQTRMRSAPGDWLYKTSSFLSYPILIGDRRLAVMNFTDKVGGINFGEHDLELLDAIVPQIAVAIDRTTLKDMAGEFEQLSVTDALTGLLNRRYLEKRLSEEILRSKRHRFPMSIMLLDVDNFKAYNDTFGHPAGDTALKIVANVLKDILRGADVAARYGGEEFAILLPQTTSTEAAVIAERLRQRIERTEFPKRRVTISIGIAACSNEIETADDIIGAADHALYEAKNHGRNNVRIYDGFGKSFNDKIN